MRHKLSAVVGTPSQPPRAAQSLHGFTWPGIEYGEPPCYKHTFFEVPGTFLIVNNAYFADAGQAIRWHF